ncbi:hypothetical protein FH972_025366 [Carpinus fangiana]|uniref:CRAL-TRIO domain-containing protein n=1 Tax=Carpinus fangiana TaxID=176857 RepID=A0A5N6L1E8_9ROSI|nr:hypothetical protein FH972_025366 [Carpinus fangiana]
MENFNEIDEQQEQNPSKDVSNKDVQVANVNGIVEGDGEPKKEVVVNENTKNEAEIVVEEKENKVEKNYSFGEEINFLSHLKVPEKKAWAKLKTKIEEAIRGKMVTHENPKKDDHEAEKRDGSPPPTFVRDSSLREESNNSLSELKEYEKKAFTELRAKVEEAIHGNNLLKGRKEQPDTKPLEEKEEEDGEKKEITKENDDNVLWGVVLLPSKGDNGTDEILLKFLRAREFNANEAFEMLRNTLQWRKENDIDSILNEKFDSDLDSIGYMNGVDRHGHHVCYNNFGLFGDDDMYNNILGTEEKRGKFLRWRVQLMEKGIQKLDFKSGGLSSFLQINNLKEAPSPLKKELRLATNKVVGLLQDNYPEFVAKNIFINVPFWFYAFTVLLFPFLTQRTKSKFVFARPAKAAETLLKYISVSEIPVHYGGLKRENDSDFSTEDTVMEVIVNAGSTESIEIPVLEVQVERFLLSLC